MRTIALVVEYDGTAYCGFQRQSTAPSIAHELETALATILGHEVKLVAAGRTDAGVHACGQVVSFTTGTEFPLQRMPIAVSALLRDRAIAVVRAREQPQGFSARFDALARSYRYRIINRAAPSPLERNRAYHVSTPLDVNLMREALAIFVGSHDFASFSTTENEQGTTTRTVFEAVLIHSGDCIDIEITADAFLHRMVRIIVGTLVEVGRGKLAPSCVRQMLASGQRGSAAFSAPPHGLYLIHVRYAAPI